MVGTHPATCPAYQFNPLTPVGRSVGEGVHSSATAEQFQMRCIVETVSTYQRTWETRALRVVCQGIIERLSTVHTDVYKGD